MSREENGIDLSMCTPSILPNQSHDSNANGSEVMVPSIRRTKEGDVPGDMSEQVRIQFVTLGRGR